MRAGWARCQIRPIFNVTKVPDSCIPELITDGVNGLLCPPENPECLAEKIIRLIEDTSLRERLGCAARAYYVQSPFEAKSASNHFISVYREVLEERKKPGAVKQ